eukprot:TRINITY_DN11915_c0_g2_i1.p1 TRINITY_DN11915_c0_g2~~TRINITY_DN11915_c0_g2_i1.p1  ORF type:complete len:685 (+),score=130.97 TRINITY_DN11915_c0_g2_i1:224-2056(+)
MDNIMNYVLGEISNGIKQGEGLSEEQARRLDGALLVLGQLQPLLSSKKNPYKDKAAEVLCSFVMPFYGSRFGHIRAKACWLSGVYFKVTQGDVFLAFFNKNIQLLANDELPVRVDAAIALKNYVDNCEEDMLSQQSIEQLLLGLMKIANEVAQEDVVFVLECLFEKIGDRLAPYALNIGQQLVQVFWAYFTADEETPDADEDNFGNSLASYSVMRAMTTLLEAVKDQTEIIYKLEDAFFPILDKMCSQNGSDIFEEVCELIGFFTYFSPQISERMWQFWPRLHQCLTDWAIDYFEDILVVFDNFITKGNDRFIQSRNPNYQDSIFQICQHILGSGENSDMYDERDVVNAAKLMEIVLINCKGKVDKWIGPYIQLALNRLNTANDRYLQDYLVLAVANCFYYNSALTLSILQQLGAVQGFFQKWFQMLFAKSKKDEPVHFKRKHDKKICALALTELIRVQEDQVPAELRNGWGQVMLGLTFILQMLKQQYEQEAIESYEEAEAEDVEDEGEYVEVGEDSDLNESEQDDEGEDDSEDGAFEMFDMDDYELESSVLDEVDAHIHFAATLHMLQTSLQTRMEALLVNIDQPGREQMASLVEFAKQVESKQLVGN